MQEFIDENISDGSIDWDEYDVLMSSLPDDKYVHFFDQVDEPENWDHDLFGKWCPRRLLFAGVPSMHSESKVHKVVISFIPTNEPLPQGFVNRFGFFQPGLERVLEWACVGPHCKVGLRNNSCCAHVAAILLLVSVHAFDESTFVTAYKPLHYMDVANPRGLNDQVIPDQQPSSGSDADDSN